MTSDGVNSIAFSNGYSNILAIGNEDSTTKLCEIESYGGPINLKVLATVKKNEKPVISVAVHSFLRDGFTFSFLATCDSDSITIWRILRPRETQNKKWKVEEIITLDSREVTSIVFHPIAHPPILAISSSDIYVQLFQINDTYNGITPLKPIDSGGNGVNSIAFNKNGTLLAIGNRNNRVTLYNISISENSKELNYKFIEILPPNYSLFYNSRFNKTIYTLPNKTIDTLPVMSVAFDYSGKFLAAGSQDKTIKIWSIDGNYLMTILAGHTDIVTSVAFFPNEYFNITNNLKMRNLVIATSSLDKTTKLWVVKNMSEGSEIKWTPQCVETIKNDNIVKSIAFRSIADPRVGNAYFLNSLNIYRLHYSNLLDKFSVPKNNSSKVSRFRFAQFPEEKENKFGKVQQPGGGLQNESRFFKLVSVNGKEVDGGRYELPSKTKFGKEQTRGPKNKASIAFSEICKKNNKKGECSYKFAIQETTRGSNKKVYNYEGKRVKLTKPIVLELNDKKVVIKYKNVITPIH